ncbi:MAG: HAD hydrolase family protein [Actinomycetota bacterium]|nr:HAD hydrolase family protein [Actinomycetota bacterium]
MTLDYSGARRGRPHVLGVVSDLDGMLLRSDGSLSPTTMSVLETLTGLGVPLVVATARTPRALRKVSGHGRLGRAVCANGAIVWDAGRDEVAQERWFGPSALAAAVHRLKLALPGAGVALLSARTMFLDDTYMGLRTKRADGAEVFSDIDLVVSRHRIVMVAVRHPRLTADHLLTPTVEAFAGVGLASLAGLSVVDIVPGTTTKAFAVAGEMASRGCAGSDRRVRRHAQRSAAVRVGRLGLRGG